MGGGVEVTHATAVGLLAKNAPSKKETPSSWRGVKIVGAAVLIRMPCRNFRLAKERGRRER